PAAHRCTDGAPSASQIDHGTRPLRKRPSPPSRISPSSEKSDPQLHIIAIQYDGTQEETFLASESPSTDVLPGG
ncbi:Hypothetical predicted protein, partial [Marmota monax]